jgi:predicted methyltransferase
MVPPRPTLLAQLILRDAIREGDTVIDATAGHGHDTVFLAECAGAGGRVLAFDLQESAIRSARAHVTTAGFASRVEFHQTSHARMAECAAADSVSAVMFNLGYLPGGDHDLTTRAPETLTALAAAAGLLKSGGVLTVVCYPGHPAGAAEAVAVEALLADLTKIGWRVAKYAMLGTLRPAPFLLAACKS